MKKLRQIQEKTAALFGIRPRDIAFLTPASHGRIGRLRKNPMKKFKVVAWLLQGQNGTPLRRAKLKPPSWSATELFAAQAHKHNHHHQRRPTYGAWHAP
jgi:hypothetical protein